MSEPEIRIDQLTGLRAILAPGRSDRPNAFQLDERPLPDPGGCPFCEGHEQDTPGEVWAERPKGGDANGPGWTQRAVPNLYPALIESASGGEPQRDSGLSAAADPLRSSSRTREPDLFSSRPAAGAQEVIVHTPRHVTSLGELEPGELAGAVTAWRARMSAHSDAALVQLIVIEGAGAGASREHCHAQLYALPFVPAAVARERERVASYRERTGGAGLLTDLLAEEVRRGERLVAIDDEAALICPWASRSPFELRIVPRNEAPRFEQDGAGAAMLATAVRALSARFGRAPDLNLWVRSAPRGVDHFHWHIDVAPRLTVRAGFELATGVDINVYPPERAAADLRETLG
ncbi:MAG: galactose-1-phosphate uridylyltransferase [Solirubrobacterales bacterium]